MSYQLLRYNRRVDIRQGVPLPEGPDVDLTAWAAAVVAAGGSVSSGRQTLISNLIKGLKTDGVWTKLDRLWITAGENTQSALIDLVARSTATVVSTPSFTVDRGYAGEDVATATKYIDSNFTPSVHGVKYTQNSAHYSAYCITNNIPSSGGAVMGTDPSGSTVFVDFYLNLGGGANMYGRINDGTASGAQTAPSTRIGHWLINRSGASATQVYQAGSLYASPNAVSGALPAIDIFFLTINWQGSVSSSSPNTFAAFSMGGSLNSTEAAAFNTRLGTYLTAVGAI
jgi:hypothetical protein